jgi:hypothetical protein
VLIRAGHFTLQAAGAFARVDVQGFLHDVSSLGEQINEILLNDAAVFSSRCD